MSTAHPDKHNLIRQRQPPNPVNHPRLPDIPASGSLINKALNHLLRHSWIVLKKQTGHPGQIPRIPNQPGKRHNRPGPRTAGPQRLILCACVEITRLDRNHPNLRSPAEKTPPHHRLLPAYPVWPWLDSPPPAQAGRPSVEPRRYLGLPDPIADPLLSGPAPPAVADCQCPAPPVNGQKNERSG